MLLVQQDLTTVTSAEMRLYCMDGTLQRKHIVCVTKSKSTDSNDDDIKIESGTNMKQPKPETNIMHCLPEEMVSTGTSAI